MSQGTSNPSEREQRVNEIIAAYLQGVDQGQAPDRQALLDRHPEFREELQAFFTGYDRAEHVAGPVRYLESYATHEWTGEVNPEK